MKILLWDDEKEALEKNKKMLEEAGKNKEIFCEFITCTTLDQLFFQMEEQGAQIELMLLDIIGQSDETGIEVAKKLRETYEYRGEIVFVSKTDWYVIQAFDVHAFHYIVKGRTSRERLIEILEQAIECAQKNKQKHLLLKGVGEFRNIAIDSIQYFEVQGYVIVVHYGTDKVFEFVSTMEKLANLVMNYGIIRIHRAYLVSVKQIKSFSYKGVVLNSGVTLPVGRKYFPELKELFTEGAKV